MRITPDEIRLIAFVLIALLVGAVTSHWRQTQRDQKSEKSAMQIPAQGLGK